jgi:hypothetical protein
LRFCLEKEHSATDSFDVGLFRRGDGHSSKCLGGGGGVVVVFVGDLEFEQSAENSFVLSTCNLVCFLIGGDRILIVLIVGEKLSVTDRGLKFWIGSVVRTRLRRACGREAADQGCDVEATQG